MGLVTYIVTYGTLPQTQTQFYLASNDTKIKSIYINGIPWSAIGYIILISQIIKDHLWTKNILNITYRTSYLCDIRDPPYFFSIFGFAPLILDRLG